MSTFIKKSMRSPDFFFYHCGSKGHFLEIAAACVSRNIDPYGLDKTSFYVTAAHLQSVSLGEGPINPIVLQQDNTVFGFAAVLCDDREALRWPLWAKKTSLDPVLKQKWRILRGLKDSDCCWEQFWFGLKAAIHTSGLFNRGVDCHRSEGSLQQWQEV